MRRSRIARVARIATATLVGAGTALVALAGSAAAAPVGTVSPASVKPGQSVRLTLTGCSDPRQGGRAEGAPIGNGTTARSPIDGVDLRSTAGDTLNGTATIVRYAQPGVAQIYLACASDPSTVVTVDVTVTG
ncbi:hypothetical protein [Streptomyces alanosinicus]|uniref:Uncharacterized protein n=1 Tax=Streptomyces alanosinicus TaxID=68171 RepID=A0A918YCX8_9ACTN|nr:hypothetical protein [Streptomyces alanosinicus]GHD99430.1 hypothetical protein GCM10010339_10710 [Streptomyces alanosinicus]